ncbi:transmembrane protein [Rhynchospora pubera]|uniref:Transmembrane protein n=1 Tax=Rhynchospora pubera TaxID=906938 RepID=A0AAV8BRA4_9POAL|nr:transmembrane protein [Rhynchospora pubera]
MEEKQSARVPINKRGYLDWQLDQYEKEMIMSGYVLSNKPIPDLLQNCDLPPPLKFFSPIGEDDKLKPRSSSLGSTAPLLSHISSPDLHPCTKELESRQDKSSDQITDLLRALQLSQTRAREAEKEYMATTERNQQMMALLLNESLRLSAHKQWVRILETENSVLKKRKEEEKSKAKADDVTGVADMATWCLAFALCLGIAGVGLALGKCLF